jgi:protein-disulfide isomerase
MSTTKNKQQTSAIEDYGSRTEDPVTAEVETVTLRKSLFYSVLVTLAFAAGILVGYVAWGHGPTTIIQQVAAPAATPTPMPVVYDIETAGYPSRGPADAPITIVEFSDYQCPYCYNWHEEVYKQLMDTYPDQIRFVYRNFPLSFHKNAEPAAEAALCAGDQNSYWEYHDILFANQELLNSQEGTILQQSDYNKFASDLSLDVSKFEECMTSRKYKAFIEKDVAYAASLPLDYADGNAEPAVGGTPSFFINGHRLGGAYPFPYFKQIIDAELAKK